MGQSQTYTAASVEVKYMADGDAGRPFATVPLQPAETVESFIKRACALFGWTDAAGTRRHCLYALRAPDGGGARGDVPTQADLDEASRDERARLREDLILAAYVAPGTHIVIRRVELPPSPGWFRSRNPSSLSPSRW